MQGAPPQANLGSGTVNTNVNLRRGPGTNYNVITLIPAGAAVVVGDCNAGWCQVTYQGQDGYVIATATGLGQAGPPPPRSAAAGYPPPPGYPPDYPAPVYVAPPPYYGPYYYYGYRPYYGYGPYYGWRGGYWRRHW